MSYNRVKPYNELPLLPPKHELESKLVLRKVISAGRALAELKGMGISIPNQQILINTIMLQEAEDSSRVENILTTDDRLYSALNLKTEKIDIATKEVLRYNEALWEATELLRQGRPLTTNIFVGIVQTITQNKSSVRKTPGTTIKNDATGEIIYTPPEGESLIRSLLFNLEKYIHDADDIDTLIKLAVIHYQFEAIHPFNDGNGRTGRIICVLYLYYKKLLKEPIIYLSQYIIKNKGGYYRLLRNVTEKHDWEPWVLYMLDAIEKTALNTCQRILLIRDLIEQTLEKAKKSRSLRSNQKEFIELLFSYPYIKINRLVKAGMGTRLTVTTHLTDLEHLGVLKSEKRGREKFYYSPELLKILS